MFKKEINRTCRNTVFPLISVSPLISMELLSGAIFYHYLNQEAYGASMQTKEKWKYCSHFDILIYNVKALKVNTIFFLYFEIRASVFYPPPYNKLRT